jgi:hypothetical protein
MTVVSRGLKFLKYTFIYRLLELMALLFCREEKRKQKRLKKMGLTEEEEIAYRSLVKPNNSRSYRKI